MSRKTLIIIRKLFYRLGVHAQFYPTPTYAYNYLRDKDPKVQEHELKNISKIINVTKNSKFYNSLLKLLVPKWTFEPEKVKYIKGGLGESSLDTFRKVEINKQVLFEKVYFTSSIELEVIKWFDTHVYDLIPNSKIKLSKIKEIFPGEIISILYFDFLDLKPVKNSGTENILVDFTRTLYEISLSNNASQVIADAPEYVKDYTKHIQYQRSILSAKEQLSNNNIKVNIIESNLKQAPIVLTHGDVQESNIFQKNILIDWDSFGIYPIGFDPAYLLYRQILNKGDVIKVNEWIKQHYKPIIETKDWSLFRSNFLYFLFIFSSRLFEEGSAYNSLKSYLIKELNKS